MEYAKENDSVLDEEYLYFKNEILKLTGIDLNYYKEKQMKRRINTLIKQKNLNGYEEFVSVLNDYPNELAEFLNYITINVTEFFRTGEHWNYFQENVLSQMATEKKEHLRIWSCACSSGEEPYSIVMSLAEYLPLEKINVFASDLDTTILAQAKKGFFSEKAMENVSFERKEKFFIPMKNGWQIKDEVKKCVTFQKLDLLKEEYPSDLDLIVCRNILIYFTEEAKDRIYQNFYNSLVKGGYLFTGNTEQLIFHDVFGFKKLTSFIYQK